MPINPRVKRSSNSRAVASSTGFVLRRSSSEAMVASPFSPDRRVGGSEVVGRVGRWLSKYIPQRFGQPGSNHCTPLSCDVGAAFTVTSQTDESGLQHGPAALHAARSLQEAGVPHQTNAARQREKPLLARRAVQ